MNRILALILCFAGVLSAQKSRPLRAVVCNGAGSATAATCSPSPALSALSELSGTVPRTQVLFTPTANTTGALTLAISGMAATPVVKYVGGAAQALAANDLRAATSYTLDYDGTNFVVKSNLGNGGGAGAGDVLGPASATDNAIAVFDSTTGKLIKVSGCRIVSSVLTCGDGTTQSLVELPELTANGANKQSIYGAASQASDGCSVWPVGNSTSGQVLTDAGSSVTIDGKTCRVMGWTTPASGSSFTMAYCWLTTNCADSSYMLANQSLPGVGTTAVYGKIVHFPGSFTMSQVLAGTNGGTGNLIVGIAADNNGLPGTLIANTTCSGPISGGAGFFTIPCTTPATLPAGTYHLRWSQPGTGTLSAIGAGASYSTSDFLRAATSNRAIYACSTVSSGGNTLPDSCGTVSDYPNGVYMPAFIGIR